MSTAFTKVEAPENLHARVTRTLALRVIEAERASAQVVFPNEAELCQQLGISRTILREAVKVLADKGMVEVRPRSGTRSTPRAAWHLLDPDILAWQAQTHSDARFLRDLCEVRLAIEPTAAGFAAVRATSCDLESIERCLVVWESLPDATSPGRAIELDLQIHTAVVAASHNPLFEQLSATIREPYRVALSYTARVPATVALGLVAYRSLFQAIREHHPMAARSAAEEIVAMAMLAVEQVIRSEEKQKGARAVQEGAVPA